MPDSVVLQRELEYHEKLYSGFAQQHFAKPAVRELRTHMADRIVSICGLDSRSRVLSIGCGIGDTELLLARRVAHIRGIDLSPAAVAQASEDAAAAGLRNTAFEQGSLEDAHGSYDAVIAIFFLHHLPDSHLDFAPRLIERLLKPGGVFYSLDPNRYRLSGWLGRRLVPKLMAKYQSPDERELEPASVRQSFERDGFEARVDYYDFFSSPMAGLFPSAPRAYRATRWLDEPLRRTPLLRALGSNFEIVASKRTN